MFLDNCLSQEEAGFPKAKATLSACSDDDLRREYHQTLKDSFGAMFGHNAKKMLVLVEAEIARRPGFRKTIFT
jgi:hypothetical protein